MTPAAISYYTTYYKLYDLIYNTLHNWHYDELCDERLCGQSRLTGD